VLRNSIRVLCGPSARRVVSATVTLAVVALTVAAVGLVLGVDSESSPRLRTPASLGCALQRQASTAPASCDRCALTRLAGSSLAVLSDRAAARVRLGTESAIGSLRRGLTPVADQLEALQETDKAARAPAATELQCLRAVAAFHATMAAMSAKERAAFPAASAASAIGGLATVCLVASACFCALLCVGAPGAGFPSDKGLQLGLTLMQGEEQDAEADAAGDAPASSSSHKRRRAGSDNFSGLSGASRVSAPGSDRPRRRGAWGFVWVLALVVALVLAIGAGYMAVRVAYAIGEAPATLEDAALAVRPVWYAPAEVAGEGSRDDVSDAIAAGGGIESMRATVFRGAIPPRCAAAMEQSQAAWSRGAADLGRVPARTALSRAVQAIVGAAMAPLRAVDLDALAKSDAWAVGLGENLSCGSLWPVSLFLDAPGAHPAAIAHRELAARMRSEAVRLGQADPELAGAAARLAAASGADAASEGYGCSDWVIQTETAVARTTILFVAAAIVAFVTLQVARESVIDAAGLGLHWRLKDLGIGLGVDLAHARNGVSLDEEDMSRKAKRE